MVVGFAVKDSVLASASPDEPNGKIEGILLDKFTSEGNADFIVSFNEKADLSAAYTMDWDARGQYVYKQLTEAARSIQAPAIAALDNFGIKHQSFFAANTLYVWAGNLESANVVAALPGTESIRATRVYEVDPIIESANPLFLAQWAGDLLAKHAETNVGPEAIFDWGITDAKADQFWSTFGVKGDGIVVANIDTGVDWTHEALQPNYKCAADPSDPECWLDPAPADCTGQDGGPCDNWSPYYHGTHTMGTMAGKDDPTFQYTIGMAPNAQWIACNGCPFGGCPDYDLFACADWVVAPGGNPDARPNVVNNSWGGGGGNNWYLGAVNSWRAAGVFPAFSAGNNYSCNSLGSPGDYQESFGVAAHQITRDIAGFSSKGPSAFGDDPYTKPNISAPGQDIISAMPGDGYQYMSGTSMASPHVAGAVALLWSCNPGLVGQIDQTFQILQNYSDAPPAGSCGAPADGEGNFTFGYGYLDPWAAGFDYCGDIGYLEGYVTIQGCNTD
jgi:subtilisin family serine protease